MGANRHFSLVLVASTLLVSLAGFSEDHQEPNKRAQTRYENDPSSYEKRHDFLQKVTREHLPVESILDKVLEPTTQAILVGEQHGVDNALGLYPYLMNYLDKRYPDFDCLLKEGAASLQPGLERFMKGEVDYETGVAAPARDLLYRPISEALLRDAKVLGWSVFYVDHPDAHLAALSKYDSWDSWNEARNTHMAQQAAALLKSGACHRVLLIAGRDHVISDSPNLSGVKQKLEGAGVFTKTISAHHLHSRDPGGEGWEMPDGAFFPIREFPAAKDWRYELPPQHFAFATSQRDLWLELPLGRVVRPQRWSDFDCAIVGVYSEKK